MTYMYFSFLKRSQETTAYPCSQLFQGYNFQWRGIQQLLPTNYKASFLQLLTWEGIFHVLFVSFFYPFDFLVKENYGKSCQRQMFRPPRARCLLPGKRQSQILRSACRTISKAAARSGGCTNEKICDFVTKLKSLNFYRFSSANFEPSPPHHFTCASVNTRVIFVTILNRISIASKKSLV